MLDNSTRLAEKLMTLPTITQKYPPIPLADLTQMISSFSAQPLPEKKAIVKRLVAVHPVCSVDWGPGWKYRRARVLQSQEVPATVDEVIWRKGAPAALGRANPAGFQVLYLADRVETALREVHADDDSIMLGEFVILPGRSVRIAPVGELASIQRTGRGYFSGEAVSMINDFLNACQREDALSLLITDSFLLDCLTNTDDDYELSSSVAMAIFEKQPAISVIAFPSRRQVGAVNLAVRVERFWDNWGLVSVKHARAVHLAQGYYRLSETRHVDGITVDGALRWREQVDDGVSLTLSPAWTADE